MRNPDDIKAGLDDLREATGAKASIVLLFDHDGQMQIASDGVQQHVVAQALAAATSTAVNQLVASGLPQA